MTRRPSSSALLWLAASTMLATACYSRIPVREMSLLGDSLADLGKARADMGARFLDQTVQAFQAARPGQAGAVGQLPASEFAASQDMFRAVDDSLVAIYERCSAFQVRMSEKIAKAHDREAQGKLISGIVTGALTGILGTAAGVTNATDSATDAAKAPPTWLGVASGGVALVGSLVTGLLKPGEEEMALAQKSSQEAADALVALDAFLVANPDVPHWTQALKKKWDGLIGAAKGRCPEGSD